MIAITLGVVAFGGLIVFGAPRADQSHKERLAFCKSLYAEARSAQDSLEVDRLVVTMVKGKGPVYCWNYRYDPMWNQAPPIAERVSGALELQKPGY